MMVKKVILQSLGGYRPTLDSLVAEWMRLGVRYVGVVGVDAELIEAIIDEVSVGDGTCPYFMRTAGHDRADSLEDAVALAEQLSDPITGPCELVEF